MDCVFGLRHFEQGFRYLNSIQYKILRSNCRIVCYDRIDLNSLIVMCRCKALAYILGHRQGDNDGSQGLLLYRSTFMRDDVLTFREGVVLTPKYN